MDRSLYAEMISNLNSYDNTGAFSSGAIFVFGHCEASLTVIDELDVRGHKVQGILDNNVIKLGIEYRGIPVMRPDSVLEQNQVDTKVLLATRFYEQMNSQLRNMGFVGQIIKLVDYNTFSEYSLSEDTIMRKRKRLLKGTDFLDELKCKYKNALIVLCPFNALGDIYFCLSYLPAFLKKRGYESFVICVSSAACKDVVELFGTKNIEVYEQGILDAIVQAAIYEQDERCFIAHQDRPYVVNLHKVLYEKMIPLEMIYKVGVFGLDKGTEPVIPTGWCEYDKLEEIPEGKAAVLSPYAKSVTALPKELWNDIVDDLISKGYKLYTNVAGEEKALMNTEPISVKLSNMKSVVERAGMFIGIRSGLCDVLRTAKCRKIALFPDYYYGDTQWKAIDMYALSEFENIVAGDNYKWQIN